MTLSDISNGPDWIIWVGFSILALMAIVLISGHGSGLIAGYNAATKEEKAAYDEKKLCRTVGCGMAVIALLVLIMGLLKHVLPSWFAYVTLGIVLADVITILILSNTICKK